jgi:hypothetical protein
MSKIGANQPMLLKRYITLAIIKANMESHGNKLNLYERAYNNGLATSSAPHPLLNRRSPLSTRTRLPLYNTLVEFTA